ncbi:malto-oligosyltrehalose trehalohydrolase [Fibrella aestuarina]|nr:malto-oligosyltrehalose trehalohydrolase [Fibrella aestuarina]
MRFTDFTQPAPYRTTDWPRSLQVSHRQLGVTFPVPGQANVLVWAPLADDVALWLPAEAALLPLTKDLFGYWQLTTDQLAPGDLYAFVLNGQHPAESDSPAPDPTDRDPAERSPAERSPTERSPTERSPTERSPTERSPTERSPTERSPTERSPTERSPTERSPTERSPIPMLPDPASLSQPEGVHGLSRAVDTGTFPWEDTGWVNPPLAQYLLYELHTGTFTPEGTFAGIEEKLDYLKALGVNAIEIMPIAEFPGDRNWGYDGVNLFAAHHAYGGATALQHLVDACHFRGIAVVLDVVYNHFGPEGNYLSQFGPYLTDQYNTPWGKAVNYDDAWCDGVRRYVIENALMWLRDFHVDALRLDAVHAIKDFSPIHILRELRQRVDELSAQTGRTYYLIVESDLNDPRVINPLTEHGYGMDAQWVDEFHHALRVSVGEEPAGYYADYERVYHLSKSYIDAYAYDGQFSQVRQKRFGLKVERHPGHQFIVFSQNHDQVGNRKGGERSCHLYSFEMLKLMAGAVLVSPFIPMLFMGEEWAETNPFFYFVHHSDPALIASVRAGRQAEFAAFYEDGNMPDPQRKQTFRQTKLQWHLPTEQPHQTLLRYYQTLITLRKQLPALYNLNRQTLRVFPDEEAHTLVLHRWHQDQHLLCLMNFTTETRTVQLPDLPGDWTKLLDSADQAWLGPEGDSPTPDQCTGNASVYLHPESIVLYAQGHESYRVTLPPPIPERLFIPH